MVVFKIASLDKIMDFKTTTNENLNQPCILSNQSETSQPQSVHMTACMLPLLVIPALALGENEVESGLGRAKAEGRRGSGNGTSGEIGNIVANAHDINQKVLFGQVGGIRSHKKSRRSPNGERQTGVRLAIFKRGTVDVLEGTAENRPSHPESEVKGRTTTQPGSGKDLGKGQIGSLQGIHQWLPGSPRAKGGRSQQNARMELLFQVDTRVVEGLLGAVIHQVTAQDAQSVTSSRR